MYERTKPNATQILSRLNRYGSCESNMVRRAKRLYNRPANGGIGYIATNLRLSVSAADIEAGGYLR